MRPKRFGCCLGTRYASFRPEGSTIQSVPEEKAKLILPISCRSPVLKACIAAFSTSHQYCTIFGLASRHESMISGSSSSFNPICKAPMLMSAPEEPP